jgi:hypothetical protein
MKGTEEKERNSQERLAFAAWPFIKERRSVNGRKVRQGREAQHFHDRVNLTKSRNGQMFVSASVT